MASASARLSFTREFVPDLRGAWLRIGSWRAIYRDRRSSAKAGFGYKLVVIGEVVRHIGARRAQIADGGVHVVRVRVRRVVAAADDGGAGDERNRNQESNPHKSKHEDL